MKNSAAAFAVIMVLSFSVMCLTVIPAIKATFAKVNTALVIHAAEDSAGRPANQR